MHDHPLVVQKIKKNTAVEQNDAVIVARLLVAALAKYET